MLVQLLDEALAHPARESMEPKKLNALKAKRESVVTRIGGLAREKARMAREQEDMVNGAPGSDRLPWIVHNAKG